MCDLHAQFTWECGTPDVFPLGGDNARGVDCSNGGLDWENSYRRPEHWIPTASTPMKTVLVNFVICRNVLGLNGWQDTPAMLDQFEEMIDKVNLRYAYPGSKAYPSECEPPIVFLNDSRIRFKLNHVYFLEDNVFNDAHNNSGLYDILDWLWYYHPGSQGALNHIFTEPAPPNNVWVNGGAWGKYTTYLPHSLVWTRNAMNDPLPANWGDLINHIAHEYGHSVGLHHTYNNEVISIAHYDFLDDVFGTCPEPLVMDGSNPCYADPGDACTPPAGSVCFLNGPCFFDA